VKESTSTVIEGTDRSGRPPRTREDKAAIVFLDYRFSTPYCQRFLPLWIRQNLKILSNDDGAIARELAQHFFKTVY